ncbi:ABC transporter permease [Actinomycetospora aeridis]|uniref:ABC transporter permease n=1 Tax=Actinomycetospora aeridis TaxID=3129231 RepID=A0ABU8MXW1_9PSEU
MKPTVLAALVVLAVIGVVDWPTEAVDFADRLAPPSSAHPLGTDQLGRDVLARVLGGVRYSLGLGLLALAVAVAVGTASGLASGWWPRHPLARGTQALVDVLVALPALLVGLVVAAVLGSGLTAALFAIVATGWAPFARQAHRLTVAVRGEDWVLAATALGAGPARVLGHHVLPAVASPLLASVAARFAGTVLTLAGLSFLGLGVQPPTPEWGAMLAEGRTYVFVAPWLVVAPAAALVASTVALGWIAQTRRTCCATR